MGYFQNVFTQDQCAEHAGKYRLRKFYDKQFCLPTFDDDYMNMFDDWNDKNIVLEKLDDYGYTKTSENTYVNEEVGLSIEVKEDMGYQQFYITIIE